MRSSAQNISRKAKFKIGFTIVELLIFFGLTSIFLTVLTDLFVAIFDVKRESEATSAVEQDGRFILERLIYDISRASAINAPASLGASADSLSMTIGGVSYTYDVTGGVLNLTNDTGVNRVNSSQTTISNLTFQRIGDEISNETVRVEFSVNSVVLRNLGSEVREFQTTVGRR